MRAVKMRREGSGGERTVNMDGRETGRGRQHAGETESPRPGGTAAHRPRGGARDMKSVPHRPASTA